MAIAGHVAAAFDYDAPGVRQTVQQNLGVNRPGHHVQVAAEQQHRLLHLSQQRP